MVVHFVPAHRCVELLESLTGAAPSVGFVHGMLSRTSTLLIEVDKRIRALITLAYAVCADETPLRIGSKTPRPGRKKAEKYLLVACTEAYTHYLFGDRDLETFKAFVLKDLTDSVVVHDRYQLYDNAEIGTLTHQLCCQHLLRDLAGAAELYPEAHWPTQIADALRGLIHQTNLARDGGLDSIDAAVRDKLIKEFEDGVTVGLSDTLNHGGKPGERKAHALLEVLRDRPDDVLRFAHRPARAAHLQPGRARPATRQDPTEDLRTPHQRETHRRSLPDSRIPLHRGQARPQHDGRAARRLPRPALDPTRTSPSLTRPASRMSPPPSIPAGIPSCHHANKTTGHRRA